MQTVDLKVRSRRYNDIPSDEEERIRESWAKGREAEAQRLRDEGRREETSPGTFGPEKEPEGCKKQATSILLLGLSVTFLSAYGVKLLIGHIVG